MPEQSTVPKLFGKYHELVLLILGFILTTFVGSYLASRYQDNARLNDDRARRLESELQRASAHFEELSRLLDRRLFRARSLVWAYKDKAENHELAARRRDYRLVIAEWNENLNRNLILTERYFGWEMRDTLENEIAPCFTSIHRKIDDLVDSKNSLDPEDIEREINQFNPIIYSFNLDLLKVLQNGQVGSFLPSQK